MNNIRKNVCLASYTTMGVGGKAEFFANVRSFNELQELYLWSLKQKIQFSMLGAGSNTLVSDNGVKGLVVCSKILGIQQIDKTTFRIGSGETLPKLSYYFSRRGLAGFEFAAAIPGSIGGACFMNASASNSAISDVILHVEGIDEKGTYKLMKKESLAFSYRSSILQEKKLLVTHVVVRLKNESEAKFRREILLKERFLKQPLKEASSGCMFKNPRSCEFSAAQLIDRAGLKGVSFGDAVVSSLHANFILNRGKASKKDIMQLLELMENQVKKKFGVVLEREICLLKSDGTYV